MRHGDVRLQTSLLAYVFVAEFTASKPIAVNCNRRQFDIVVLFMQVATSLDIENGTPKTLLHV